ncbi:MAG: replication initiator protein A [Firmicutes bacterium]|nr:replication initiator protein A [Bacillota bacterium]
MEKLKLSYLTVNSAKSYSFYMIPKELIDNPAFDSIDYGTKIFYSLTLNRASLSATNPDFIDDKGNVYIIYTVEQAMADMRCSTKTAVKMFKQLEEIGLIERYKQGQGKPAIIYVKDFSTLQVQTCKKYKSRSGKNTRQEVEKVQRSNTYHKNPNFSKTDSINQPSAETETHDISPTPPESPKEDTIRNDTIDKDVIKEDVKNQIELDSLQTRYPNKQNEILELYHIIVDILASRKQVIRIAKEDMPASHVKEVFSSLDFFHLQYVIECLAKNTTKITSTKSYLQTTLFNAPKTINNYYSFEVQHDFADDDTFSYM